MHCNLYVIAGYSNDLAANFGWRRRLLLQFMRVRARKRRAVQWEKRERARERERENTRAKAKSSRGRAKWARKRELERDGDICSTPACWSPLFFPSLARLKSPAFHTLSPSLEVIPIHSQLGQAPADICKTEKKGASLQVNKKLKKLSVLFLQISKFPTKSSRKYLKIRIFFKDC